MVGRTVVGWENPILGWCALRYPARGLSYAKRLGFTGGSLCSHPAAWRSKRLVLCGCSVVDARFSGSFGGGRRNAAGASQCPDSGGGGCFGFLASGSV